MTDKETVVLSLTETLEHWCDVYEGGFGDYEGDYGDASVKIDKDNPNKIKLEFGWSTYEEGDSHDITILIMSNGKSCVNHKQDGHCVMSDDNDPVNTVSKFNLYEDLMTYIKGEMGIDL